jgi:phosphopantothenoylcysteine decarboxylase/phosphopantothenate--cysteine ligase
VTSAAATADVVIMAAAVSDYAPVALGGKLKKTGGTQSLQLQELPDILASLGTTRAASSTNTASAKPAVLVGFAAETATGDELEQLAGKKLRDKGCDLIIANDVSGGAIFGDGSTSVLIVDSSGATSVAEVTKEKAAVAVITAVAARLG